MRRVLIVGAAVAVAAVLFVVLRPGDDATNSTTTTQTTTRTTQTTELPQPLPRPPRPAQVRIVVRNGQPVGGPRRVTVSKGRRVVLVVISDVADEVHLHGYDLKRDVAPGKPARLAFKATIVGTVEVELEARALPLARITTQP